MVFRQYVALHRRGIGHILGRGRTRQSFNAGADEIHVRLASGVNPVTVDRALR
jgi:hypothetical protein